MINFDDIDLDMSKDITPKDEDEKDKKTDDEDSGDDSGADENENQDDNNENDSNDDDSDNKDGDDSEDESEDEDSDDDDSDDKDGEEEDEDKKTIPFHEHPDWKKMQDQVRVAEERAAKAETDAERAREITETADKKRQQDPDDLLSPAQLAVKRIRAKQTNKEIDPKDQAEVTALVSEEIDNIKADRSEKIQEAKVTETKKINQELETTLDKLDIKDKADRDKVITQVLDWKKRGMAVSMASLEVAAEHLKVKGELGPQKKAKPKQTQDSKDKEKKAKADKDSVNKKSKRKGSGGGKNKSNVKTPYKAFAAKSLDDIVLEQGAILDNS